MKILIHTQYFPPETGAPQNRLYELGVRLSKLGYEIHVLTAMPNYPAMKIHEDYRGKVFYTENMGPFKVFRSWIFVSKSKGIVKRLLNYFSFVLSSFIYGFFKLGKYDVVFCESPPLFLGMSAFCLAKVKRAKFIFNVSDLWPESAEKLGLVTNPFMLKMATKLEEWLYRKSVVVTGQTQGIVRNIKDRFPAKEVYWLPNGVDPDFYDPDTVQTNWRNENNFEEDDLLLLYAGIIGHAQGLEVILKAAQRVQDHKKIKFILLGDGPVKPDLLKMKEELKLENVFFFDPITKDKMPPVVKAADMALIPLKKLPLFEGAIPSKIFENLAMKKPILLGVDGEAKELFIDEGKCGLHFEPENDEELSKKILSVYYGDVELNTLKENARSYIKLKFDRKLIAKEFDEFLKKNLT